MPMMAFIGVRISWDMLARNMLLVWVAASACSFGLEQCRLGLLERADVHDHPTRPPGEPSGLRNR